MQKDAIQNHISNTYPGLNKVDAWGETSWFYNPNDAFARGTYFCTLKEKDGDNDKGSNLDREGVFRLNTGLPKAEFEKLFGAPPSRPAKGGIIEGPWNLQALDTIMPHPVYGWMSWVCVLNPSVSTFETFKPLLDHGYAKAVMTFEKKLKAAR
ncbi:MAG: DUF6194 family protein [Nitratireductor sp.]